MSGFVTVKVWGREEAGLDLQATGRVYTSLVLLQGVAAFCGVEGPRMLVRRVRRSQGMGVLCADDSS